MIYLLIILIIPMMYDIYFGTNVSTLRLMLFMNIWMLLHNIMWWLVVVGGFRCWMSFIKRCGEECNPIGVKGGRCLH